MLKGLNYHGAEQPLERTAFRTSWTTPEGAFSAFIFEARVIGANYDNWTVDCASIFDLRKFFDIQVASPYLHSNRGEGVYVAPEIGSKCYVCIPSDGPPPFVMAFLMPSEAVTDIGTKEDGTHANLRTGSTYAGGRERAKPGDIVMRGRDGNFCVLHRGGVLQVGSTELAQRIFIPLGNLVTDISQTYNHFNSGGAINWGVTPSSSDIEPETVYKHTFRVTAGDENADVRVAVGTIKDLIEEDPTDDGSSDLQQLKIGTDDAVVFEFAIAPGGFTTDSGGVVPKVRDLAKLRLFFDRGGNGLLRAEGSIALRVKKKLRIRVDDDISIFGKKNFTLEVEETGRIAAGKSLDITTKGGVIKLNGGSNPVATVGSIVQVVLTIPVPIMTSMGPGTITAGAILIGQVTTGNPTILA